MRIAIAIWTLLFTILVVACSIMNPEGDPVRPDGPHFDHVGHMDRGIDCTDCHGEEDENWQAMPSLEFCMECHEEIDPEVDPKLRAAIFYTEAGEGKWAHAGDLGDELIFDHKAHVSRNEDCSACHDSVAKSKTITTAAKMRKPDCFSCHDSSPNVSNNDCALCHTVIRKDVAPRSHRGGWHTEHGRNARVGLYDELPADCAQCHTRSSCQECHLAEQPRSHTNLWRLHGHGAMASIDRESCAVCHTEDSCVACHRESTPRSHRATFGAPFNRHCVGCHLPVESLTEGCAVCHKSAPSHMSAPMRPLNPSHMTMDPNDCRECHTPPEHPDNGQSCLICHK